MAQTLPITETVTTLNKVRDLLNLSRTANPQFFIEWFENLPLGAACPQDILNPEEKASLDRIKNRYLLPTM